MKIKPVDYSILYNRLSPYMSQKDYRYYERIGLTLTRYVWDVLHSAGNNIIQELHLYDYLNDTHITTALKRIYQECT
jgi:hypothetical protein